jgi:hypothetical protein
MVLRPDDWAGAKLSHFVLDLFGVIVDDAESQPGEHALHRQARRDLARNRPASSVVEYDSVLSRRTFAGRVTGDASSGTAASGNTYLMLRAGAIEEAERRLAPRVVTTPREREVVDVGKSLSAADENVGRLHDRIETGTTAVVVEFDNPLFVLGDDLPGAFRRHSPEVEAMRQADEIGGKAIATDMRAFPRLLRAMGKELVRDGAAVPSTTGVMLRMRAYEVEGSVPRTADKRRIALPHCREIDAG